MLDPQGRTGPGDAFDDEELPQLGHVDEQAIALARFALARCCLWDCDEVERLAKPLFDDYVSQAEP